MTRPCSRWRPYVNRMRLRRSDGQVFMDRWGVSINGLGGIMVHRITSPDPGPDLHDHPWAFLSVVLSGGYREWRAPTRKAVDWAKCGGWGWRAVRRRRFSVRLMRLDECHQITEVDGTTWTLVVRGPHRREWGFYTPEGWVDQDTYDRTRVRDLVNEVG